MTGPHGVAGPILMAALLAIGGCGRDRRTASPSTGEPTAAAQAAWRDALAGRIRQIDADMPGEFGVYVKDLGDDTQVDHRAGRVWYLSSTIKVPVAIAVLEQVDAGRIALDQELTLRESDYVDGAGDLVWQAPGARYSVATLLEKSLRNSDSTATDMLIRLVGEDELNRRIADWTGEGFGRITTILQVRYDAYGELHPGVERLSNVELVGLRRAEAGEARLAALVELLGVQRSELSAGSIDEAFERYYDSGRNSATLSAYATMLERLAEGDLLSAEQAERLLGHMRAITTGERRIQAGLAPGTRFAQKTGTQLDRACNMGIIGPDGDRAAIIVAACAEDFGDLANAERAFQALGAALQATVLAPVP